MSPSNSPMQRWESAAASNPILTFLDSMLRGFGQVMFQNSPITGLFFLIGLFVGGFEFGAYALLACAVSTATAYWLGVPHDSIGAGLYGYNAVLVGVALAFYLDDTWMLVPYTVLGAAAACIASAALGNILGTWQIPALTGPFVVTIWLFALGIYGFSQIEGSANSQAPALPALMEGGRASLRFTNIYEGLFKGVSEVFFQNSIWVGIIFLIGIFLSSQIDAALAIAGSVIGLAAGWFLGVDQNSLSLGLMGYNGVLTMIALAGLFYALDFNSIIVAAIAVVVTVVVSIALTTLAAPYGGHIYTAPFVLTTYGLIAAKPFLHRLKAVAPADSATPEGSINLYRRIHWWDKRGQ